MKTTYPAPVTNLLDGITDISSARKKLYATRTNQSDDSLMVNWDADSSQLVVRKEIDSNNNVRQITATDNEGIFYQKKVDGAWTNIPTSVTRGGTGATTANDARTNLGLNPVAVSITAASNVTLTHNESFKIGKVGFIMAQFTINADNVSTLGTIASGSRPNKNFYGEMFYDADKTIIATAISSNGTIACGGGYTKGKPYRMVMPYWIA